MAFIFTGAALALALLAQEPAGPATAKKETPKKTKVTVTVTGPDGETPVKGAQVRLNAGEFEGTKTTNDEGNVEFEVKNAEGEAKIRAKKGTLIKQTTFQIGNSVHHQTIVLE
ncbi:MAG: hypothetical protein FJW39_26810 [Acidobacteria bacterium]|nr:hypothetical protein [Acidobacteriota bacterium]